MTRAMHLQTVKNKATRKARATRWFRVLPGVKDKAVLDEYRQPIFFSGCVLTADAAGRYNWVPYGP